MAYEESSIYKQGLQKPNSDGFAYLQKNGNWTKLLNVVSSSWVDIGQKIGSIFQPSSSGNFSFSYNKELGIIIFNGWINFGYDVTNENQTLFNFNADLPGSSVNKLFSAGNCIGITQDSNLTNPGYGNVRIIPNDNTNPEFSRKVSFQSYQINYRYKQIVGMTSVMSVNPSLVDEFNAYLI